LEIPIMIHTRICDLFGIDHPIINAPMAGVATAELAAAVSEAGGLGLIGGTFGNNPDWLREQIRLVRSRTQKPFGVGFISSFPGLDQLIQVAIDERVPVIGHSFADPTPYVPAAHAAGIKVIAQVQKVAHAKRAALAGVDVITAQGTEAGGHTGYSGTLPLVPAVIDVAGGIPVVAAGGIADGRGLAAVLMLGAEGVWLGSRFVASHESIEVDWKKQRAVEASTDDTILTKVYDLISNAPFPKDIGDRVLNNSFTSEWHGQPDKVIDRRTELKERWSTADQASDPSVSRVQVGNATGLILSVEPAGEIIRRIIEEAETILRSRPQSVLKA
jgi:nitronate monooxygenase